MGMSRGEEGVVSSIALLPGYFQNKCNSVCVCVCLSRLELFCASCHREIVRLSKNLMIGKCRILIFYKMELQRWNGVFFLNK